MVQCPVASSLVNHEFKPHQRLQLFPLSRSLKNHPHCLVLVDFRNGFERNFLYDCVRFEICLYRITMLRH